MPQVQQADWLPITAFVINMLYQDSPKLQLHNIQLPKDMRELPKYCRQTALPLDSQLLYVPINVFALHIP